MAAAARLRSTQSGFGLLELLVALGIFAFVFGSISSLNLFLLSQSVERAPATVLEIMRRNIIASVLDDNSWRATINGNQPSMACLSNSTIQCSNAAMPVTNQPFVLRDSAGGVIFDGVNDRSGFTAEGESCGTFDSMNATADCFLRYNLTWSAMCVMPNCTLPIVTVQAQLRVAANAKLNFNPAAFSVPPVYRVPP